MNKNLLLLFFIFLAAFFLRIFLINWTLNWGYNGDFVRYEDWARIAHVHSFAATYTTTYLSVWKTFPNNQPPGSLYILSGAYESWITVGKIIAHLTHSKAGSIIFVNTHLQHIFMKSPAFLSDLLMGLFIYLLVAKEAGKKRGLLATTLVLFTPITFYNSAIWGQMDSINNLFFILSLFFAFRNKIFFSIFAYSISIYIKLSLLPLLPFYLIFLYFKSNKQLKKIFISLCSSIIFLIIATYPISHNPLLWLCQEIPVIARGEFQNVTLVAFNFWWAVTCLPTTCHLIPLVTDRLLGLNYGLWAYVIFGLLSLPFIYLQIKNSKENIKAKNILLIFSLIALLVFLFLPNMHDRYMYPVFPLLSMAVALSKQLKTYLFIFCTLSLLHLTNLLGSWYPAPFPFFFFYQVLYSYVFRWSISVATLLLGGFFYWNVLKE